MSTPLAITGLGCIAAPGSGLQAQLKALRGGISHLRRQALPAIPLAQDLPMGTVQEGLPLGAHRNAGLAASAGAQALEDACLDRQALRHMGLIVGTSTGGMLPGEAAYFSQGATCISQAYRTQQMHTVTRQTARYLGIRGPQSTHSVACVSAACALSEAACWLRSGLCEACLVLGSDAHVRITSAGFHSLQLIDRAGCRPFTQERAGMSLGEAGAALLLETPAHARKRGARIYACLAGWGLRSDAYHPTTPDPQAAGLISAIEEALGDAGITADQLGWINAHGTGTLDNDACEARAFAACAPGVPISSLKRIYGHSMGAAAAVEAVASCLALYHQEVYPSCGWDCGSILDNCPLLTQHQHSALQAVLSTNLAFAGMNAALVFCKADRCF